MAQEIVGASFGCVCEYNGIRVFGACGAACGRTVIGNQAVATFESGGQTFSVTSNLVQTTINTIAGVQIETDTTKSAVAGGKVLFPHTITNVGNAADRYNLTTTFVPTPAFPRPASMPMAIATACPIR